jgi:hypothetical protein
VLSGEKPPWDAELRFELGPASQQASACIEKDKKKCDNCHQTFKFKN